ncbi:MAG: ribonuclease III [Deltaproteobacteria bacterium]|nr:ribonuclease III [Deltaproteobacteria bacterium]
MNFNTPIEQSLSYRFKHPELLLEALTHSTFANEHPELGADNQRLEFLGDAVVGLIASQLLYLNTPNSDEGELSRRRSQMVRRESLAALARELNLGTMLRIAQSQKDVSNTDGTLADVFEALVAAIFLDGGFTAAKRCILPLLKRAMQQATGINDHKTALQEACHAHGIKKPPKYVVVSTAGPAHARVYVCEVIIAGKVYGQGHGSNKKTAEQACAASARVVLEKEWNK